VVSGLARLSSVQGRAALLAQKPGLLKYAARAVIAVALGVADGLRNLADVLAFFVQGNDAGRVKLHSRLFLGGSADGDLFRANLGRLLLGFFACHCLRPPRRSTTLDESRLEEQLILRESSGEITGVTRRGFLA